ncbi:membrane protein insertion efficiency factor YidD [Micromonospora echinofusca]|uniref:Membrane protein insertion efficiency factor YidD n=1 Tax=Micromonospora echinofusca TaxID=47858 RepID=A0ABS3VS15_MICEH|nr:membrane protein insertion efficiency factor YidD [Micromonospora echinofusca]MBO4207285.1 membrane protein insertion efficiency factor YidD [Micromonospora echinofusca]
MFNVRSGHGRRRDHVCVGDCKHNRHHHKGRKKKRHFDSCDGCDCDGPDCCDFGLFSTLLMLGASVASVARVPVVDRAGSAAIRGYRRWLSPHWPGRCRFTPTCGAYGLVAVERYGLAVGGRMAADRVRRCGPKVPRGTHDPVVSR